MARKSNALTAREVATIKAPGWYADGAGLCKLQVLVERFVN